MRNNAHYAYIFVFAIFAIIGIGLTIMAWGDCGFGKSMLYGKNLIWAWYWGYCDV